MGPTASGFASVSETRHWNRPMPFGSLAKGQAEHRVYAEGSSSASGSGITRWAV